MHIFRYSLILLATLGIIACHKAPVLNIESSQITSVKANMNRVENAIMRAATSLNWKPRKIQNGLIEATLLIRTHKAVVEIPYSTKAYSIRHKTSENLKFDGKTIHSYYNSWVQNLDNAIQRELLSV
jgi:hypothetical protein